MSQEKNNQMLAYMGVDKLHALGYKGNGIKVMILDSLNDLNKHGEMVKYAFQVASPNASITLMDNDNKSWDKAIAEKYDIVHISMTAFSQEKSRLFVQGGGIVTCATGNYTTSEFSGWDHVIDIGACWIREDGTLAKENFSASSETLDLVSFVPYKMREDGTWFQPIGTSFSSPFGSGGLACMLEHWKHIGYKYTPQSVKEYLIKHAVDILAVGKDNQSGYGYVKVGLMNTIKATIGKNSLVVNGMVKPIPQGAVLVNGNTMVPFRAIGDAIESVIKNKTVLSYKTDWEPTTKTAIYFIDTK